MTWKVEIAIAAARQLERIQARDRERILRFLYERVASNPNPMALGKRLSGSDANLSRFRVGDYRIIAQFLGSRMVVFVVEVGNRREVYR